MICCGEVNIHLDPGCLLVSQTAVRLTHSFLDIVDEGGDVLEHYELGEVVSCMSVLDYLSRALADNPHLKIAF